MSPGTVLCVVFPLALWMIARQEEQRVAWWLSGSALDLRFTGRGFNSRPVAFTYHRPTQSCIPPGSLNRVPASAGGKGGILTSVGWQVTLCDPI